MTEAFGITEALGMTEALGITEAFGMTEEFGIIMSKIQKRGFGVSLASPLNEMRW